MKEKSMAEETKETAAPKKRAAKKKTAPKKKAAAKKKSVAKKATTATTGKPPVLADKIEKLTLDNPDKNGQWIADKAGASSAHVYNVWKERGLRVEERAARKKRQKNTGKPKAKSTQAGEGEAEFRRAARAITLNRAQEILNEIAAAYGA